ncbi:MAG: helix-turn-helix transcriptional regulator, partial [Oscillospiraceae bacterium]|nr:helix-turn-helix transcriptional regulator [Oscillospiraceae bacterium]
QNITKQEFAERIGVSRNYLYVLTGNSRPDKNKTISRALAKLIAIEFGYDEDWIMNG